MPTTISVVRSTSLKGKVTICNGSNVIEIEGNLTTPQPIHGGPADEKEILFYYSGKKGNLHLTLPASTETPEKAKNPVVHKVMELAPQYQKSVFLLILGYLQKMFLQAHIEEILLAYGDLRPVLEQLGLSQPNQAKAS